MSESKSVKARMGEHDRALFSENIAHQASFEVEHEVPEWHRAQAFEQHFEADKKNTVRKSINWGMWFGVPALSMACSAFAITVVMAFMQEQTLDQQAINLKVTALIDQQVQQKVAIQLASQSSDQSTSKSNADIEALINIKLREFAAEQQVMLANYRADISTQQQSNNLALASYVIGASRKERKEDISDFINFINAQREDEQLTQKIKFQQLEREISFQKIGLEQSSNINKNSAKPTNYQG
ncbi:hypothetical protein [Colwellia psychrerythraea]|uniref:Uncharacterized protein n=1 Tax=Colwellia psychrerythraea TaxID=28229 RepID=A0A099L0L8_COLPS|nr:hypothetical protein [Colwellia psychrerythraea]KGJ96426.1 hypothetical protein GAB14E_0373 [Colwellia psychrerythraea]